jgi:hypothetical protein
MGLKLLLVVPGLPRTVFHSQNPTSCSGTFTRRHSPATFSVLEIYRQHHRPFVTRSPSVFFSKSKVPTTSLSFKGSNLNHLIPQPHTFLSSTNLFTRNLPTTTNFRAGVRWGVVGEGTPSPNHRGRQPRS